MNTVKRSYPRRLPGEGGDIELRLLRPDDEAALLAFAKRLAPHDLLFLPRDIGEPKVVAAWVATSRDDESMLTLLATRDGAVCGCATLVRDPLSWSRHVGELRVIVDPALRGSGLGQKLAQECFAIALEMGVEKLVAQMTTDQRGAIAVFEGLGFRPEALLHDHVKDRAGRTHDIVVLAHDVAKFAAQHQAYGVDEAL
jgi:RimJ/RimL family protein N-acetyltransferase